MPPGSDERQFGANSNNGHTTYSEKNNLRYLRLIRKYSSIIQGQFFGHLHSDSFRIVYDDGKIQHFALVFFCLPPCYPQSFSLSFATFVFNIFKTFQLCLFSISLDLSSAFYLSTI